MRGRLERSRIFVAGCGSGSLRFPPVSDPVCCRFRVWVGFGARVGVRCLIGLPSPRIFDLTRTFFLSSQLRSMLAADTTPPQQGRRSNIENTLILRTMQTVWIPRKTNKANNISSFPPTLALPRLYVVRHRHRHTRSGHCDVCGTINPFWCMPVDLGASTMWFPVSYQIVTVFASFRVTRDNLSERADIARSDTFE